MITTHRHTSQNQHIGINVGDSLITPSSEPSRNMGVLFDSTCSLNDKAAIITCIPSGKWKNTLIPELRRKLFYNITRGLLQQSPLWSKRLHYIPATALPEQYHPGVFLVPQIRSYHSSSERSPLAACCAKNQYNVQLLIDKALHRKALHLCPSCCLCTLQPGIWDQISFGRVW